MAAGIFQFAGHTLDVARGSLQTADREVELRPKSFEVLAFLVENAHRLVTKEELIQAVWPNVTVTDDVLTHCVSEIRNAIGDDQQSIVKTVPRRGYRFAAPVSLSASPRAPSSTHSLSEDSDADRKSGPPLPDRPSIAVLPFQKRYCPFRI